jgi:hypothetical protein
MTQYKFVFKETPVGKAKHGTHLDRRKLAVAKAGVLQIYLTTDVEEMNIGGDWYYTWTVDTPNITALWAFIRECTRHPNVALSSDPIPVFTAEELSQIEILSTELRKALPDK